MAAACSLFLMAYLALVCAIRAADSEMALNERPGIAPPPLPPVPLTLERELRGVGDVLEAARDKKAHSNSRKENALRCDY